MNTKQWLDGLVEEQQKQQMEELEADARMLMNMGYKLSELCVLSDPDGSMKVVPLSLIHRQYGIM